MNESQMNATAGISMINETNVTMLDIDLDDLDFWPLPASADECQVQVLLCAANKCPTCGQVLMEEEVMSMWAASDSVFNAVCPLCGFRFIPKLEIYIKDFRNMENENGHQESEQESERKRPTLARSQSEILSKWCQSELTFNTENNPEIGLGQPQRKHKLIGPISCIFLSPLALRKEIEQATERNNASTSLFADASFVDNHDNLYFNMLFVNFRMQFHSHLPSLVVYSKLLQQSPSMENPPSAIDFREAAGKVNVLVVWDNLGMYNFEGRPLYWHWTAKMDRQFPLANAITDFKPFSRRLMSKLLTSVRRSDILTAIRLILLIRRRGLPNERFLRHQSMYRTILNLSMVAFGRYNVDIRKSTNKLY